MRYSNRQPELVKQIIGQAKTSKELMDYLFYVLEKEWDSALTSTWETKVSLDTYRYYDGKLEEIEHIYTTLKDLIK